MFEQTCDRCGKQTDITLCSQFNTEGLCMQCKKDEEQHPQFQHALKAEHDQILDGNRNYKGVGLPSNLN